MPRKNNPGKRQVRRSEDDIRSILKKVADLREQGSSISQAIEKLGINSTTYYKWINRFGKELAEPKSGGQTNVRGTAKPKEEVIALLKEIENLRNKGISMTDALEQTRVPQATYYKWRKKYGAEVSQAIDKAPMRKATAYKPEPKPIASSSTDYPSSDATSDGKKVVDILEEMAENRRERVKLEEVLERIKELDAQYAELLAKL